MVSSLGGFDRLERLGPLRPGGLRGEYINASSTPSADVVLLQYFPNGVLTTFSSLIIKDLGFSTVENLAVSHPQIAKSAPAHTNLIILIC